MKKIAAAILSVLFATVALAADTQRYQVATTTAVRPAHIGAMMRSIADTERASTLTKNATAFENIDGFAADLTAPEAFALAKSANVRYVEPVVERHALDIDAPKSSDGDVLNPFAQTVPFGVDLVRAREVWSVTRGQGINVVIADTGIDVNHPELAAIYAGGLNTYDIPNPPIDDNEHGTHVAGTIAAADNNIGVVGVAPGVRIWAVKVLNSAGSGSTDRVISAIDWTITKKNTLGGNWIMNFSLGSATPSGLEREAFARANNNGILVCAASGNESSTDAAAPVSYPAAYPNVLAIGAIDSTKAIASFSNQGPQLAVVAPGVSVLSTVPVGKGTSAGVSTTVGSFIAAEVELSKKGSITAQFVDCGIGNPTDFPASVAGKIAVIKRGTLTFNEKAHNAVNAGAVGIIIYNHDTSALNFTLKNDADPTASSFKWPVTIAISLADGQKLLAQARGQQITITDKADDYAVLSGTSMATPHAVGVAALVWGAKLSDTAAQIRQAMTSTAADLGSNGFDNIYGNGLLDALSAAKAVAPEKFGSPTTPPAASTGKKRSVGRH